MSSSSLNKSVEKITTNCCRCLTYRILLHVPNQLSLTKRRGHRVRAQFGSRRRILTHQYCSNTGSVYYGKLCSIVLYDTSNALPNQAYLRIPSESQTEAMPKMEMKTEMLRRRMTATYALMSAKTATSRPTRIPAQRERTMLMRAPRHSLRQCIRTGVNNMKSRYAYPREQKRGMRTPMTAVTFKFRMTLIPPKMS